MVRGFALSNHLPRPAAAASVSAEALKQSLEIPLHHREVIITGLLLFHRDTLVGIEYQSPATDLGGQGLGRARRCQRFNIDHPD